MAATEDEVNRKLTFRRYEDGVNRWRSQGENIFNEDTSHKCPTYVHRTPPCQGSCPSGEDIRGWLNIVRGIELPPEGVSMQEYAFQPLYRRQSLPVDDGPGLPGTLRTGLQPQQGRRLRRHQLGRAIHRRHRENRGLSLRRSAAARRQARRHRRWRPGRPRGGLPAAPSRHRQHDLRRARRTRRHVPLRHSGLSHAARIPRSRNRPYPGETRRYRHPHGNPRRPRRRHRGTGERTTTPYSGRSAARPGATCRWSTATHPTASPASPSSKPSTAARCR